MLEPLLAFPRLIPFPYKRGGQGNLVLCATAFILGEQSREGQGLFPWSLALRSYPSATPFTLDSLRDPAPLRV